MKSKSRYRDDGDLLSSLTLLYREISRCTGVHARIDVRATHPGERAGRDGRSGGRKKLP